ncbi:Methylmalonyl-CoA carboxyltransferase [Phytophthora palmivora]|uniref:Methylmalonyl-CoA carboxyltransferase n=1 Tax=Phytophthora palmivora TaxID=4796 RepID=A0A2P4YT79_9STRA|nr:Methylmalonyl-CoA carboxyltransferase [Phytophthora palmivora]
MTHVALKIWQFVAKYTTKPLLCQGVEGDMAMAKNARRVFPDESAQVEEGTHIAFDDKCKLITSDKAMLYTPPTPRVQVIALANWEFAPTFALDEHLVKGFPEASTDRLLNKCNPFLSGKRRARSEDLTSNAPTVSTDCSTIPENDVEELDAVEEEADLEKKTFEQEEEACEADQVPSPYESNVLINRSDSDSSADGKQKIPIPRWICVGHGRYVKCDAKRTSTIRISQKTEPSWTVRWVQVGYGRYTKYYVNGDTGEKVVANNAVK